MNNQLQVFYTNEHFICDRVPYGDKLKMAVAKQYNNSQCRLNNGDYDHLPMWMRLGRGNSMKQITGYSRKPGMRVIRGCRPFYTKDDNKTELDLGYVQFFTFDIDLADKAKGKELDDKDMQAIMKVVENTIPRIEIDPTFIIESAYINRSGSVKQIHLTLAAKEQYKMSMTKANNIKKWLYQVIKAKFIGELNSLNIDKFVMDDNANNGIKKLFFSDSQEKLRHIALVGDYKDDNNITTAKVKDNSVEAVNLPCMDDDKEYKKITDIKSMNTLLFNRQIRRSIKMKEIIHKGNKTVKMVFGSAKGKKGYDAELSCIVGERPSPRVWDFCNGNGLDSVVGALLHIYQQHSIFYNLRTGNIPADIMKLMYEKINSVSTRDDVIKLYKEAINKMSGVVRGKRRFIEASKKLIKKLNKAFSFDVKEIYIRRDKVGMDNNNDIMISSEVPFISINSIIKSDNIKADDNALIRYTDHNTSSEVESMNIKADDKKEVKEEIDYEKARQKRYEEEEFRDRMRGNEMSYEEEMEQYQNEYAEMMRQMA